METIRDRARLVACELKTKYDVSGKPSPSLTLDSFRHHNCLLLLLKLTDKTYNAKKAYLRGKRRSDDSLVFLRLPAGFDLIDIPAFASDGSPNFLQVTGNLYGLQDAGCVFWNHNKGKLLSTGWIQSDVEPCLFYLTWKMPYYCPIMKITHPGNQQAVLAVYVDDHKLGYRGETIEDFFNYHFAAWYGPDSGNPDEHLAFMGCDYMPYPTKFVVNCNKTRRKLKGTFDANGINILKVSTQLPPNAYYLLHNPVSASNPIVTSFPARGIVGSSSWVAMCCAPFASHACCVTSQQVHRPTKDVCYVIQWLGSFIVITIKPLIYRRPGNMNAPLVGTYSDSSQANNPSNMSSYYGVAQEMCCALVSWSAFSGWQVHASTRDAGGVLS